MLFPGESVLTEALQSGWTLKQVVPNPWGEVPVTAGGKSLTDTAKAYMARVYEAAARRDPPSTRHHYVPKAYLRAWSSDARRKRVCVLHADTGKVCRQGIADTCVKEHLYRVRGLDGEYHQQVEKMMAVFDDQLASLLVTLRNIEPGDDLSFDNFMTLGHMIGLARNRTPQTRRLLSAYDDFLDGHNIPDGKLSEPRISRLGVEGHLDIMFGSMFDAADLMTTRHLEVWDDPRERFFTSDSPVQTSLKSYLFPGLDEAPRLWWPISPGRALCLARDTDDGAKVRFMRATASVVRELNTAMIRGHESVIIATEKQLATLPVGKPLKKRPQIHLRCEPWEKPGQCRVAMRYCYAARPDIKLCSNHHPMAAPERHA